MLEKSQFNPETKPAESKSWDYGLPKPEPKPDPIPTSQGKPPVPDQVNPALLEQQWEDVMKQNKIILNERGDKLGGMEKRASDIEAASKAYLERARELNRQ